MNIKEDLETYAKVEEGKSFSDLTLSISAVRFDMWSIRII